MKELVSKFPSIVARPYILIKDDLQKKDMQRFWFENTISFLAILAGSDLVNWYKNLKFKENKTQEDIELIQKLVNHISLTSVGLDQMSLGKWVMMLRETTKFLKENNVDVIFPEVVEFFNKENEKIINDLVKIRNNDAHGNPIPQDKLDKELNKRQEMINKLVKNLAFLSNYQLIYPESIEIVGSKQFYLIKEFIGNNIVTSKIELNFTPRINDVIIVNQKNKKYLSILPFVTYLGKIDESMNFLGIFSKFTDKNRQIANYLNLEGHSEVDFEKTNDTYQIDFVEESKEWYEIYSSPKRYNVNLDVKLEIEENNIHINEINSFNIFINNKKSTQLYNVKIVIELPNVLEITKLSENDIITNMNISNNKLIIEIDSLEEEEYILEGFEFNIKEQGFFNLNIGNVFYNYYSTEADRDAENLNEGEMEINGDYVEVIDPSSKDKLIPIINVKKEFLDINGNPIKHSKIGEDFIFEIKVENIGFSSAKDVLIDVIFPEGLNLKKGKETIRISELNPLEEKNFQYVCSSKYANIYTLTLQNIIYSDINEKRYTTKCSDEYFIVVRSDILTDFKYKIEEFIEDLYIDEDEQAHIDRTIKEIEERLDIDAKKFYQETEMETVINIIRDIFKKVANKKGYEIVESIYEESKSDSKITNKKQRKSLVFNLDSIPFFAINLSNGYDIEFFGLKSNIKNRFEEIIDEELIVDKGRFSLNHKVDYDLVRNTEKYSVPFFKQWANILISTLEKDYIPWKKLNEKLDKKFNIHLTYLNGAYEVKKDDYINKIITLKDFDENELIVAFYINTKKISNESKNLITKYDLNIGTSGERQLTKYYFKTTRKSSILGVLQKVKSLDDINKLIKKVINLYNDIQYAISMDIFENEEMKNFVKDLYKKSFLIKKIENPFHVSWTDRALIYNYNDYLDFEVEPEDSIAVIGLRNNLEFFPKTYDDFPKEILEKIKMTQLWAGIGKHPLIFIRYTTKESYNDITNYILDFCEKYEKDKLFIWPKSLRKEAIINFAQFDYMILVIAQSILENQDIHEFDFINEKDIKFSMNRLKSLEEQYKFESPIKYENDKFFINNKFIDEFNELYEESNKNLTKYIKGGHSLTRYRVSKIRNYLPLFKNQAIADWGIDKRLKGKTKYWRIITCYVSFINKDKQIKIGIYFDSYSQKILEYIQNFNFKNDFRKEEVGKKHTSFKIETTIEFNDYDQEINEIAEKINELTNELVEFVDYLENTLNLKE
jgi:hypothetical protein